MQHEEQQVGCGLPGAVPTHNKQTLLLPVLRTCDSNTDSSELFRPPLIVSHLQ